MDNLQTIVVILVPMFIGFCFRLPKQALHIIDRLLMVCVYLILLLIGIGLGQSDNLGKQLGEIVCYTLLLFGLITLCNLAAIMWFDRRFPWQLTSQNNKRRRFSPSSGLQQLAMVLVGLILGLILPANLLPSQDVGHYALMALVFLVGLQLRGGGITLRQILLNKQGLQLSLIFILSCATGGILFALMLPQVPISQGLALSSGYGWYSLSGIMMTQTYGASWGSIALLNDLLRELFALMFIPILMPYFPNTAVGMGGATSMDFALPSIQHSGGLSAIPVAVSFGFTVNLTAPFMMVLFSSW